MPCYILLAGDTEMVKIGWADDVEARRLILQTAHYEELVVLRVIEGERWIEPSMHRMFREHWVRGEWFRVHPAMFSVSVDELERPASLPGVEPIPLLAEIEQFLTASGMTATRFGVSATNDPMLVHDLRKGRECKRAVRERVSSFIAKKTAATGSSGGQSLGGGRPRDVSRDPHALSAIAHSDASGVGA